MVRIKILAERNVRRICVFFSAFFLKTIAETGVPIYAIVRNWRLHKSADYSFSVLLARSTREYFKPTIISAGLVVCEIPFTSGIIRYTFFLPTAATP